MELSFEDDRPVTVEPLGLVLKAGSWYLVAGGRPAPVLCLDRLRATRLTTQRFEPPPEFSLGRFWSAHVAATH